MPIELDNPIVVDIEKKDVEIDTLKMRRIWDVVNVANIQIDAGTKRQFPRVDHLDENQKTRLNERIKDALVNQGVVVVHHGSFAIILDAFQNAYYQIDAIGAARVLSGKTASLKTIAFSGKPSAKISFDEKSAWINVYLDQNSFSHELYGPEHPNDIPLIYELPKGQNTPIILFGFNPYAKDALFLEKSVA